MCRQRWFVTFVCLLFSGFVLALPSVSYARRSGRGADSLRLESLRGSLQGQAGLAADLDDDGYEDLVVGAPYASGRKGPGALLVYAGSPDGFPAKPSVVVEADGNLGWSLVRLGTVPGKGRAVFAAGAFSGSHPVASLSGTVTLFAGWDVSRPIAAIGGESAMDKFGYALAAGDFNGDTVPDLAVGAPFHSPSSALYQRGAVYVFFGPDYSSPEAFKIPATAAVGGIGFSLAAGDLSGDGIDDLLMQASGKVVVHFGSPGSFSPVPSAPNVIFSSADAGFGRSLAVLGDVDGDGFRDVAVGADQAVVGGASDSGRLFILRGGPSRRSVNADAASGELLARIDAPQAASRFGAPLQALGPADGSGPFALAVGAQHADVGAWVATGGVYVFGGADLTRGGGSPAPAFLPADAPDLHLGAFLAELAGGRLAAGGPTEDAGTGGVRIFELTPSR